MNSAEQNLLEGNLQEALVQLQNQVRKDPTNAKLRIFLFQVLAILGQWERGLTQLNVAGELDDANLAMMQSYREVIRCEVLRKEIFSGLKTPLVFGEPSPWLALLQEAFKLTSENRFSEASSLRSQAYELAPEASGMVNEIPFQWIADADSRLGPVLEVIVNGKYYWVPFHQISEIHIDEPADLRDFVWMPAHFLWANEGESFGFIPSRYSGSEKSTDSLIQLAGKTEWQEIAENSYAGAGQRMLTTDKDDYSLFDIREIKFNLDSK